MNQKDEFLTKLAALMREYNAEIGLDYDLGMEIEIPGYQFIRMGSYLDADLLERKIGQK